MSASTDYLAQITVSAGLHTPLDVPLPLTQEIFASHNIASDAVLKALVEFGSNPDADGNLPVISGALKGIIDLLNMAPGSIVNGATVNAFGSSINQLRLLLLNGVTTDGKTDYVSVPIAREIELILSSLASADMTFNWTTGIAGTTPAKVTQWRDTQLFNSEISEAVARLISAGLSGILPASSSAVSRSLQALIELVYIKSANEYLTNGLESLEEALQLTKDVLSNLADLQKLHSNATVMGPGTFTYDLSYGTGSTDDFEAAAAAHYTAPQVELGPGIHDLAGSGGLFELRDTAAYAIMAMFGDQPGSPNTINLNSIGAFTNIAQYILDYMDNATGALNVFNPAQLALMQQWQEVVVPYNIATERLVNSLKTVDTILQNPDLISNDKLATATATITDDPDLVSTANSILASSSGILDISTFKLAVNNVLIQGGASPADAAIRADRLVSILLNPNITHQVPKAVTLFGIPWPLPISEFFNVKLPEIPVDLSRLARDAHDPLFALIPDRTSGGAIALKRFAEEIRDMTIPIAAGGGQQMWIFPDHTFKLTDFNNQLHPIFRVGVNGVEPGIPGNDLGQAIYGLPFVRDNYPLAIFGRQIVEIKAAIDASIAKLETKSPTNDPNSLVSRLRMVIADMYGSGYTAFEAEMGSQPWNLVFQNHRNVVLDFARDWLIDGNNKLAEGSAEIGRIQDNIGFAISSAESLNDVQKEEVRRTLFAFEEYYKSASSMLKKTTQIMEKIAQGIKRS